MNRGGFLFGVAALLLVAYAVYTKAPSIQSLRGGEGFLDSSKIAPIVVGVLALAGGLGALAYMMKDIWGKEQHRRTKERYREFLEGAGAFTGDSRSSSRGRSRSRSI